MIFKTNPNLPVKYSLALHTALPTYPTSQDFVFDVIGHIVRVAEAKDKPWDPTEIKFSTKTLKYVFGDHMNSETFRLKIKNILKELLDSNQLIKKGEFIFIPENEFNKYYLTA